MVPRPERHSTGGLATKRVATHCRRFDSRSGPSGPADHHNPAVSATMTGLNFRDGFRALSTGGPSRSVLPCSSRLSAAASWSPLAAAVRIIQLWSRNRRGQMTPATVAASKLLRPRGRRLRQGGTPLGPASGRPTRSGPDPGCHFPESSTRNVRSHLHSALCCLRCLD